MLLRMRSDKLSWCLFGVLACFIASTEAIIGGKAVDELDQLMYVVSLQHHGEHFCGGSIINDDSILTAAHCIIDINGNIDGEPITVVAGTHDLSRPRYRLQVSKIFTPTGFGPRTRMNDLAVLKLQTNLTREIKSLHVRRLKRPRRQRVIPHSRAVIAGWGWDWIHVIADGSVKGGRSSPILRWTLAEILSRDECQQHAGYEGMDLDIQFCARVEQHNHADGVCNHDNGGALIDGFEHVIGILSRIAPGCHETVKTGIYTNVSRYRRFVENSINNIKTNRMLEHFLPPHHN